jgi:hypothetical protein
MAEKQKGKFVGEFTIPLTDLIEKDTDALWEENMLPVVLSSPNKPPDMAEYDNHEYKVTFVSASKTSLDIEFSFTWEFDPTKEAEEDEEEEEGESP